MQLCFFGMMYFIENKRKAWEIGMAPLDLSLIWLWWLPLDFVQAHLVLIFWSHLDLIITLKWSLDFYSFKWGQVGCCLNHIHPFVLQSTCKIRVFGKFWEHIISNWDIRIMQDCLLRRIWMLESKQVLEDQRQPQTKSKLVQSTMST